MKALVYIRPVTTKSGVSFQIRWRERINAEMRWFSKTFRVNAEAKLFENEVKRRLGAIAMTEGSMSDLLRPAGNLDLLIPEFIALKTIDSKPTSDHPNTMNHYLKRLKRIFSWSTTADITHDQFDKIKILYREKKPSGIAAIRTIKQFLTWCDEKRYKVDISYLKVKMKSSISKPRVYWTEDHIRRIINTLKRCPDYEKNEDGNYFANEWQRKLGQTVVQKTFNQLIKIFHLLILWAIRPKEASNLVVRDWDTDSRKITITAMNAKNSCERRFKVDENTAIMIDLLCKGKAFTDFIFTPANQNKWTKSRLTRTFSRVLKLAQVPGNLYCARHYATTQLLKKMGRSNFRAVMYITGHKTMQEFIKYLHYYDQEIDELAASNYADFIN